MSLNPTGVQLLIWIIVFTVITTIIMGLRIWAIRIKKRTLRADDYLIFIAYVSTLAMAGITIWGIVNGLGAHTDTLNADQVGVQFKLQPFFIEDSQLVIST
ncbi:hypothetical protein VTN77DRAFT_721 [Rasamsonia byssochlamydoides]|uniref:uncharacterized protein n=1 Tax=Rasamsonia byssochlamydoides TaxID=89139 RepID=UPI0037424806